MMKNFLLISVLFILFSCKESENVKVSRYNFPAILDVSFTPNDTDRCMGTFTDAGSWWGFTPARNGDFINGFCGPFHLEGRKRGWFSSSAVIASFAGDSCFKLDSVCYYPGEMYMKSVSGSGSVEQSIIFVDQDNVLINIKGAHNLVLNGNMEWGKKWFSKAPLSLEIAGNSVIVKDTTGEGFVISIPNSTIESVDGNNLVGYIANCNVKEENVVISFFTQNSNMAEVFQNANDILANTERYREENLERWNGYLQSVIREDMPYEYDRVAAKAVTTLISNWRSPRGDLNYSGVVPSHGASYFVGMWAWDSWKHAVALAKFNPELAKDQMRVMFDYQLPDGMIIDCIFSNKSGNNSRDSKPPLAAWAVNEIYNETLDTAFVAEMYPKLVKYYEWWFVDRDNNRNGICEFGSCDGTLEAAAWESGMDNAIRFDNTKMVKNNNKAWSMNQESVDLNAFLVYENEILGGFARMLGDTVLVKGDFFNGGEYPVNVADYFFCNDKGFFFDRTFDGKFIEHEGTEAAIPLWAGIASKEQAAAVADKFTNPNKFATYIPFPTIAADDPKFTPNGYWRGPIWLDQVYFGINGLRKYGYIEQADEFTRNVFDRLYGVKESAPIHENYNTHTGELLKAPHFSWSSAHLLMLYSEYGNTLN